jgi:hypothetical protein
MDTAHLEHIAEDLISHKLQRAGMLVAKPKFDRAGTDLLAFLEMGDGVKFCRIQCKGRSLTSSDSHIKVPEAYVSNGFLVVLYLDTGGEHGDLYCFFANDIKQWHKTPLGEYKLSLSQASHDAKLKFYRLDESKVQLIESLIRSAETSAEFRGLVYGEGRLSAGSAQLVGYGTVEDPKDAT